MNVKFNHAHTTITNELILFNTSFNVLENVECRMKIRIHSYPIKYSDIKIYEIDDAPNLIESLNSNEMKEKIYRLLAEHIATGIYQELIKVDEHCQKFWMDKFEC